MGKTSLAEWYEELDQFTRKEIIREGNLPATNDFYPDPEFEE